MQSFVWAKCAQVTSTKLVVLLCLVVLAWTGLATAQVAVSTQISGEIERFNITTRSDHWSGGSIQVGGQVVILPRNLLLDLPANRLTLKQLYDQAPQACRDAGETGLAKGDSCNSSGTGAIATVSANRTRAGNIIAGDVLIEKGIESITGTISYINYTDGYFRLAGTADPATGVMVRLNDPDGRHSVQQGLGCNGGPNCSADPRFTLDPNNYTNVFTTGYPLCIPSTVQRTFNDVLGLGVTTAQAASDGSGDVLCPQSNRPNAGPAADSRRMAPIKVGDTVTVEGNFESINGVRFLSAHTTMVLTALTTNPSLPNQPDYMFIEEAFIDMPGFQNERLRSLFIGFTTLSPADVLLYSLHYDPMTNAAHEFPLGTTSGCDAAGGAATCSGQGLVTAGSDIFRIRHDVDFLTGAKPKLNPCAHLRADSRMGGTSICPNGGSADTNTVEMFGIMSPMPHEIQARTGRKHASMQPGGVALITLDINGTEATNGQYLFPFGINLGGIDVANAFEFNLNAVTQPFNFAGLPWNLDRRLSPGGCIDTTGDDVPDCETTPQPLDPFPFEAQDPRTQASVPTGVYNDPKFTASPLSDSRNRILSYVNFLPASGDFNFNGDASLLSLPIDPAPLPFLPVEPLNLSCSVSTGTAIVNSPPVALPDTAVTTSGAAVTIPVLSNDTDSNGDTLTVIGLGALANGSVLTNGTSVTFTSNPGFTGAESFIYTISDGHGGTSTSTVTVTINAAPAGNTPPVAQNGTAITTEDTAASIAIVPTLASDPDPLQASLLVVTSVTQGANGTVSINAGGQALTYTPRLNFSGSDSFSYTVSDPAGASASGTISVTVTPVNDPPVAVANSATTNAGVSVVIPVLANDTDVEGNALTVSAVSATTSGIGTVTNNLTSVTYTPNAFTGTDTFTYTVSDGNGGTATASVTVTVNAAPANSAPVAANDTATTSAGLAATVSVLANDTDPNGDLLTVVAAGNLVPAASGIVTFNGTSVTFTPNAGFSGTVSFNYTVSDGSLTAVGTVTVTVSAPTGGEITVVRAEFRITGTEWRVSGTGLVEGAVVTIHLGNTLTGTVVGSAPVIGGLWTFRARPGVPLPAGVTTVSVESSAGGRVLGAPISIRN